MSASIEHPSWCDLQECRAWVYTPADYPADDPVVVEVFHMRTTTERARWVIALVQYWSRSQSGQEHAAEPVVQLVPRGNDDLLNLSAADAVLVGRQLAEAAGLLRSAPVG